MSKAAAEAPSALPRFVTATWSAVRADLPIYVAVMLYVLAGAAYVRSRSGVLFGDFSADAGGYLALFCLVLPYSAFLIGLARIFWRLRRRRRLALRYMFAPSRIARFFAGTVLILVILMAFEEMFTSIKMTFSFDSGYDVLAANIDRLLHLQHSPSHYLDAIPTPTWFNRVVEFNYDVIWATAWLGVLYWTATSRRADSIRLRFHLSFVLTWIVVGSVVAGLFPTAGPAFYAQVSGDTSHFATLHAFLSGAGKDSITAGTQHYLWSLHVSHASGFAAGISAFPSMHVALATLVALFLAERGARARIVAALFTIIIMASSVYLGWHYAIDGYAALLLTVGIYWGVRWLLAPRLIQGARLEPIHAGDEPLTTPNPIYSEIAD